MPALADVAQATGENTAARCQQLSSLFPPTPTAFPHPIEVDAAVEDCRKGHYPPRLPAPKRSLTREIPIPATETARSQ